MKIYTSNFNKSFYLNLKSFKALFTTIVLLMSITFGSGNALAAASGSAVEIAADFSVPAIVQQGKSIINTGANIASKYANIWSMSKEGVLDAIAYQMSRAMIAQMKNGMIRWIQSGYDGKPSFLINPEQMLRNMAAVQAKMVITDIGKYASASANGLSSALVTDIRGKINTEAAFQKSITPTLGITIQNNVCTAEGFGLLMAAKGWTDAQGKAARKLLCSSEISAADQQRLLNTCFKENFACGGWNAFLDLTQNPGRNTQLGQLELAVNRVKTTTEAKNAQTTAEVARGNGFLDMKECIKYKNITVNGKDEQLCDEYRSTSPGQKAVSMMNEVVTDPIKQARLANEINEAVNSVASAFMSDLVGRGFKVANQVVNDVNLTIADATNGVNNSINKEYNNMNDAIKAFTKKNPSTPAPAYNGTNLQVVTVDPSSVASLSRNMIKDMTIVASSNESYIRVTEKDINNISPYIASLNTLGACYISIEASNASANFFKAGRDYLLDRNTKVSSVYTQMQKDINTLPNNLATLKKSIDFVRASTDINAMQAVYQGYNVQLDSEELKKSEAADQAQFRYDEHDRNIYGVRDESGSIISKGDMEINLKPKISECECYKSGQQWTGQSCGYNTGGYDQGNDNARS